MFLTNKSRDSITSGSCKILMCMTKILLLLYHDKIYRYIHFPAVVPVDEKFEKQVEIKPKTMNGKVHKPRAHRKKREIRVFVSSTFKDFSQEREEIIKKSFREVCAGLDQHPKVSKSTAPPENPHDKGCTKLLLLNLAPSIFFSMKSYYLCLINTWHIF